MVGPKTVAAEIELHVRPQTFPLAIRMVPPGEGLPPKAKRPARDLGVRLATCQVLAMARRYGWTLAVTREDLNCVLTKTVFGFEEVVPYFTEGHCCLGMYTGTKEAGARTEAATHRFPFRRYEAILVSPAARADFDPDVYVVYANGAQILRLVAGALYLRGGSIVSGFTGRIDCSDEIIRPMETQEYQVILPCYGDRVFGHTEDHEMAFTLPGSKADELLEGLRGTQQGGIRYPIPSFVRYSGQFPASYEELETIWRKKKSGGE